jgi:hypothetical protein
MSRSSSAGYGGIQRIPVDGPLFARMADQTPFYNSQGKTVAWELHAQFDKGFTKTDGDWTCYRRNYFAVVSNLRVLEPVESPQLYLYIDNKYEQILQFAVDISAYSEGQGAPKAIDLVQHTTKRDKGPMGRPMKWLVKPEGFPPPTYGKHPIDGSHKINSTAAFDRVQFKSATQNNGKRRAQQQYFKLKVELLVDMGKYDPDLGKNVPTHPHKQPEYWVSVGCRISDNLVVRGRSPGHYRAEVRAGSAGAGQGGPGSEDEHGPGPGPHGPSPYQHPYGSGYPAHHNNGSSGYYSHRYQNQPQHQPGSYTPGATHGGHSNTPYGQTAHALYAHHYNSNATQAPDLNVPQHPLSVKREVSQSPEAPEPLPLSKVTDNHIMETEAYLYFPASTTENPSFLEMPDYGPDSPSNSAYQAGSAAYEASSSGKGLRSHGPSNQHLELPPRPDSAASMTDSPASHLAQPVRQEPDRSRYSSADPAVSRARTPNRCADFRGMHTSRGHYPTFARVSGM